MYGNLKQKATLSFRPVSAFLEENKALVVSGTAIGGIVASAMSHATLDPGYASVFTGIQSDGTALGALAVPVIGTVLGMIITAKLFKRFANKV